MGLIRVMAWFALPTRPAQGIDDLGRQANPPGSMRRGLDRLEPTGLTPVSYRGDIDVQQCRRRFRTVAAVTPLATKGKRPAPADSHWGSGRHTGANLL